MAKSRLCGLAQCHCMHQALDGKTCQHDLEAAGFPVYFTQGGGFVRETAPGIFVFVEEAEESGFKLGDRMPSDWGIIPANERARVIPAVLTVYACEVVH